MLKPFSIPCSLDSISIRLIQSSDAHAHTFIRRSAEGQPIFPSILYPSYIAGIVDGTNTRTNICIMPFPTPPRLLVFFPFLSTHCQFPLFSLYISARCCSNLIVLKMTVQRIYIFFAMFVKIAHCLGNIVYCVGAWIYA